MWIIMKLLPSNKKLMKKYRLSKIELLKLMNKCITYFLSEEELYNFILNYYMKKEERRNKRLQL